MALISAKNITKVYGDGVTTKVLNDISFDIQEGEFVAIMGPSGSGKSTLMHILGLLDRQTSGECFFKGNNTKDFSDDELAYLRNKEIGFVFQSFNLLARTDVFENVKLPLIYSSKKSVSEEEIVRRVAASVGLSHRLNNWPSQLSGGEQQRVAIARALVNDPTVIFADEPTGNLDSKSGEQVMEILQKLNNEGKTIILVTHETITAQHARRIIRLKDGQIISDEKVNNQRIAKNGEQLK